jgi:S-adenosylmethionine:tRNA ribosyltransferase-isomerase
MRISDFDYELPPDLIAQEPARPRDSSRMLVVDSSSGQTTHEQFRALPDYLDPDDVAVFNDTRVIRARLHGRREPGGGKSEILLLSERGDDVWEALVTPGRRHPPGRQIVFGQGELRAEVIERTSAGGRLIRFRGSGDVRQAIAHLGAVPLPPYISGPLRDEGDYQTVYARSPGASAAPTAGLHFTPEVLDAVRARVHGCASVTLHIGLSTFRPIRSESVEDHDMHGERYVISEETAALLSRARAEKRRIVAIGTSTARALEAAASGDGVVAPGSRETALFITPGYEFRVVGALLTNFHTPRSTLLLLACALAGRSHILSAYREAVRRRYRFLSFGDAMLIL